MAVVTGQKPPQQQQPQGHAAHTQDMDQVLGLRGDMPRPIKITMLGAGSGFTPRLVSDVLQIPGADRGEIALVDVDKDRLKTMHALIRKLIEQTGKSESWTVSASTNRHEVLGVLVQNKGDCGCSAGGGGWEALGLLGLLAAVRRRRG